MSKLDKQRKDPLSYSDNGDAFSMMLEAMSVEELTDALNDALENLTDDSDDSALIDAYLDALNRKSPMPESPDAEASYASFQKRLRKIVPAYKVKTQTPVRKFSRIWRLGMIAALVIACMFGVMAVAQAAGLDVFGAMARWTNDVFSFGEITSEGAKDTINVPKADSEAEFTSLQEALDLYGITEVSEPAWLPEGYTFRRVAVSCWSNGELVGLTAEYFHGTEVLFVDVKIHRGKPSTQIEKTDAPVETFAVNGTTAYLFENINNNAAAWVTEHYECFISGAVTKSELQQMVFSIYANS